MDEREPQMADTEDRLRRTMETILEPHRRPRRRARPGAPRVTTIDRLRHPSISEAGTRAAGINPEPIPSGGVTRWTAQARQNRVPRRAADLMDKRARPRSKRPRPRSGRGVRCTRHPCRQASLRVSTARSWPTAPAGDGRTQCDSLCAAPGPVLELYTADRVLGTCAATERPSIPSIVTKNRC